MTPLNKIKQAGFTIEFTTTKDGEALSIAPYSELKATQLAYLKANKPAIIQQLKTDKALLWLAGIGEDDPLTISEFINDPEKLTGLLAYIKKVAPWFNIFECGYIRIYKTKDWLMILGYLMS